MMESEVCDCSEAYDRGHGGGFLLRKSVAAEGGTLGF